jgi:hypothetical protein
MFLFLSDYSAGPSEINTIADNITSEIDSMVEKKEFAHSPAKSAHSPAKSQKFPAMKIFVPATGSPLDNSPLSHIPSPASIKSRKRSSLRLTPKVIWMRFHQASLNPFRRNQTKKPRN